MLKMCMHRGLTYPCSNCVKFCSLCDRCLGCANSRGYGYQFWLNYNPWKALPLEGGVPADILAHAPGGVPADVLADVPEDAPEGVHGDVLADSPEGVHGDVLADSPGGVPADVPADAQDEGTSNEEVTPDEIAFANSSVLPPSHPTLRRS